MVKEATHVSSKGHVVGKGARQRAHARPDYIPGQLILRIRQGAVGAVAPGMNTVHAAARTLMAKALPDSVAGPIEYLRENAGLKSVQPVFSTRVATFKGTLHPPSIRARMAVVSSVVDSSNEDLRGFNVVTVDPKKVTPNLLRHLRNSPGVSIAEPMPARWLTASSADPMRNLQWGLTATRWFDAAKKSAKSVVVGVIDTGVDTGHPDLKDVVSAYEFGDMGSKDVLGHGTHVCGIIAAVSNNGIGISGVANCRIKMWKVFEDEPDARGDFYVEGESYLRALGEARDSGLKVLNLSLGGGASSQTEQLLFRRLEDSGVVVVAAMGNEYDEGNPIEYPGAYDRVLAVGAVAETLRRSSFSNTGKHIGLCAPGSNILSTLPMKVSAHRDENEYAAWSGTSMATPHVAGAVALVAALHPNWDAKRIKKHLIDKARKLPGMKKKKWTPSYGAGLLDIAAAL